MHTRSDPIELSGQEQVYTITINELCLS
eukprot:COSAG03_NODE_9912_length_686_cov_0.925043_1_plen_27_part_10